MAALALVMHKGSEAAIAMFIVDELCLPQSQKICIAHTVSTSIRKHCSKHFLPAGHLSAGVHEEMGLVGAHVLCAKT